VENGAQLAGKVDCDPLFRVSSVLMTYIAIKKQEYAVMGVFQKNKRLRGKAVLLQRF
jgi:hypothetical protein